jgi:hypothetical protein
VTIQRFSYVAGESVLTLGAIARMLGEIAWCAVTDHPRPLVWQRMTHGTVGKCRRCGATVVP